MAEFKGLMRIPGYSICLEVPTILDSERKGKRKFKVLAITHAAEISSIWLVLKYALPANLQKSSWGHCWCCPKWRDSSLHWASLYFLMNFCWTFIKAIWSNKLSHFNVNNFLLNLSLFYTSHLTSGNKVNISVRFFYLFKQTVAKSMHLYFFSTFLHTDSSTFFTEMHMLFQQKGKSKKWRKS